MRLYGCGDCGNIQLLDYAAMGTESCGDVAAVETYE